MNNYENMTKDDLLMAWQKAKDELTIIKERELDLRKVCSKFLLDTVDKPKDGVNNISLGNDFVAKVTVKINYNLDTDNDKIEAALDRIEAIGNEGKFVAERLINWKATLSVSEYKLLMDDSLTSAAKKEMFDAINSVVTISEGAPTLAIVEPKGKK